MQDCGIVWLSIARELWLKIGLASDESEVSLADDRYFFIIIHVLVKEIAAFDVKREELTRKHEIINPCIPDRIKTETESLTLPPYTWHWYFSCAHPYVHPPLFARCSERKTQNRVESVIKASNDEIRSSRSALTITLHTKIENYRKYQELSRFSNSSQSYQNHIE